MRQIAYGVSERLSRLSRACASMGSPFYGALLMLAACAYESDPAIRALLDRHENRSRLGLRLAAAAHFRALHGSAPKIAARFPSTGGDGDPLGAWEALAQDAALNESAYDELMAMPVQTNEVARAMPILGAILAVSGITHLPLRIFEIGCSAGLLLNFDHYRYAGETWNWGDPSSALRLRDSGGGSPQYLSGDLTVAERRGCDPHPLDVRKRADADRLVSFIWPDQRERLARLRAAIDIAREHPVRIDKAEGQTWIGREAQPRDGAATVAMHTVVTEHLSRAQRDELYASVREVGARASFMAPFAWIRMEPAREGAGYETAMTLWPGERKQIVARSDGHAQSLSWSVRGE